MSAISELITYLIYGILLIGGICFLISAWLSTTNKLKSIYKIIGLSSLILFISLLFINKRGLRESELEYVGTYNLDKFPNCKNCVLELKKNNTYVVQNDTLTIEKGDWHYEAGGDYMILYLNGENNQLGIGKFSYTNSNR